MKTLAIALTLISSVAFAQKHMVRFDADGGSVSTFNFSMDKSDDGATETKNTDIALNYAYTIAPMWQLGLTWTQETEDDGTTEAKSGTVGLDAYYNLSEDLGNSTYFGVHYHMLSYDKVQSGGNDLDGGKLISLEAGKRFGLGDVWGYNVTYAPNLTYAMMTQEFEDSTIDDIDSSSFSVNWLKFDVLF